MADTETSKEKSPASPSRKSTGNQNVFPTSLLASLPWLVLLTTLCWVWSHLSNLIEVWFAGYYPLEKIPQTKLFRESFIQEIWFLKDGSDWISLVFISAVSGVWPYLHLLLLPIIVALLHFRYMTKAKGRTILNCMYAMGSWTPCFLFIQCFNVVIFDIFTQSIAVPVHSGASTTGDMGDIGYMRAAIWTEVTAMVLVMILACVLTVHLTGWALLEVTPSLNLEVLPEVSYGAARTTSRAQLTWRTQKPSIVLCATALVLLIVASSTSFMYMELGGFFGSLMPLKDQHVEMSLFKVMQRLFHAHFQNCQKTRQMDNDWLAPAGVRSAIHPPSSLDPGAVGFSNASSSHDVFKSDYQAVVAMGKDEQIVFSSTCHGEPPIGIFLGIFFVLVTFVAPFVEMGALLVSLMLENWGFRRHAASQRCFKVASWIYGFNSLDALTVTLIFRFADAEAFNLNFSCDLFKSYMDVTLYMSANEASGCLARTETLTIGWWLFAAHSLCRHLAWKWVETKST